MRRELLAALLAALAAAAAAAAAAARQTRLRVMGTLWLRPPLWSRPSLRHLLRRVSKLLPKKKHLPRAVFSRCVPMPVRVRVCPRECA